MAAEASGKRAWFFKPHESNLLALAGIWERWGKEAFDSYSVTVTDASDLAKRIHGRMLVVIAPEDYTFLLDPGVRSPRRYDPCSPLARPSD